MSHNEPNTYKQSRLFSLISNPTMWWVFLFTNVILLIGGAFLSKDSLVVRICVWVTLNGIMVSDMIRHSPKSFSGNRSCINFDEYRRMRIKKSTFHMTHGRFRWLKINWSVSNVRNIEFHQNFFEKIFDIGHVSFSGDATFYAKRDLEKIKEQNVFSLYGIKNFSKFKLDFQNK